MDDDLNFKPYIRTPFQVRAIQITEDNIEALAKLVGFRKEVRILDGQKYIALDKRMVPSITRAYVGWWITLSRDSYRVYAPNVFMDYFVDMPEDRQMEFEFSENEDIPYEIINRPDSTDELVEYNSL